MRLCLRTLLTDDLGTWRWECAPWEFGVLSYQRHDGPSFEVAFQGDDFLQLERERDDLDEIEDGEEWRKKTLALFDGYSDVMTACPWPGETLG